MKYYKLVSTDLTSFDVAKEYYNGYTTKKLVKYKVNEWVHAPDNTRLFVFKTLEDVHKYRNEYPGGKLYECEVIGGIDGYGYSGYSGVDKFWQTFNGLKNKKKVYALFNHHHTVPALLVKAVKLTKLIEIEYWEEYVKRRQQRENN